MAVSQVSTLSNSLRIQYLNNYFEGGIRRRFYDIFAAPIDRLSAAAGQAQAMADLSRGGTVRVTFISDMAVTTTALSEVQDITPQVLADATADVTVGMYGDGIQVSQKAMIERFTNYGARMAKAVGLNMMELVEHKCLEAAFAGSLVHNNDGTRGNLDAGIAGDRASQALFAKVAARLSQFNIPGWEGESKSGGWAAAMDHFVLNDIVSTTPLLNVAEYQNADLILNNEVGRINNFRILASGWAKTLYGAGTANATDVDTTLSSAAARLATSVVVTANTNIAVGQWLNLISAKESSTTFYPENERVKVASVSGTTIGVVGEGENGGLRFAHTAGTVVNHDDSVHLILFGGPQSLVKVYAPEIGEFGQMVGPLKQGLAHQWDSLAWKWFGGYGRPTENALYRAEVTVLEEA